MKLDNANSLKPENYPTFTMFWQLIASIKVGIDALQKHPCDIFIDTMGIGFSYAILKIIFGVKIVPYVHYPLVR